MHTKSSEETTTRWQRKEYTNHGRSNAIRDGSKANQRPAVLLRTLADATAAADPKAFQVSKRIA